MIKPDYQQTLLNMIDNVLSGTMALQDFASEYYDYYIDVLPEGVLSDQDMFFFGDVQEKLDWVDKKPDLESRTYGWVDHDEFLKWLSIKRKEYCCPVQVSNGRK